MKFLAFLFLFSTFSIFAEPLFYESFGNSKSNFISRRKIKVEIIPLLSRRDFTSNLEYTNSAILKTTDKALLLRDNNFKIINLNNKIDVSNSLWISYLVKINKIYDKKYNACFSLSGISRSNSFIIDLHRYPEKDILLNPFIQKFNSITNEFNQLDGINEYKKNSINATKAFNRKVISKNTIMIVVHISKKTSGIVAEILFNPKIDTVTKNEYIAEYDLKIDLKNFDEVLGFYLYAKGADVIFDEIRCGNSPDEVLPIAERKELSVEELLGEDNQEYKSELLVKSKTFAVSNSFMESIVIIKGGKSVGTGFVAKSGTNNYIYTNVHVLMGNNKMRFTNRDGKKIKPLSIETTANRDIVRLKIKNKNINALNITKPSANNTPIAVCGNSGGGDVIRTLYGKIIGVGPDKVETSAKFISGNSGSPVLLENGNAIGIAAYVQKADVNWITTNTPFSVTRRFAYRIDNIDHWKKISPKTFVKESNLLMQRDEKLGELINVLKTWANNPYWSRIQISDDLPRAMTLWIENQNDWVEHNHMRLKNTSGREANAKNLSRDLIDELNDNVEFLKKSFKRSCITKKRRWAVPFFKVYSDDLDKLQTILVEAIDHIAESAASSDPVYLKKR